MTMKSRLQHTVPVTKASRRGRLGDKLGKPRSLPTTEWPASDRLGWTQACQPSQRLKRSGAAGHLAPVSQADIANRYGLFLDFLRRRGRLEPSKGAKTLVMPENVNGYPDLEAHCVRGFGQSRHDSNGARAGTDGNTRFAQ